MGDRIHFIFAVLITGFSGIVAQTILLRETLIIFSGNEFSIGIIIGSWVVWEAIGAFLGGKISARIREYGGLLNWLMLLFSVSFPCSIFLTRIAKILMGVSPDIGVGIVETLYFSLIILLPTGFFHGMLFTTACAMYNRITEGAPSSIGKVYFYEMLGTIVGGVLVSYIFIPLLNSFEIAIGVASLNALICLAMQLFSGIHRKILTVVSGFALLVVSIVLLAGSGADRLHRDSVAKQWQGKKVISYENTLYQNIVVTRNQDQLTFYTDGIPVMTTPVPDITFAEEFSHTSLLAHSNPESILVLGGGASGVIHEILKHPSVKNVDYVEIDPQFLITVKKFSTPLAHQDLSDTRVMPHYIDGRIFIKKTTRKYDVILLGIAPPLTLQANRFFTQEFFKNIRNILNDQGILSLYLTGSTSYYSQELRNMNACMYRTVKNVFPDIFVVPGDVNLFIASVTNNRSVMSSILLSKRLTERGIKTNLINQVHLDYRFQEDRRQWYISLVDLPAAPLNKDFEPKGLYYNILFNNLLFTPYLKPLFDGMVSINIYTVAIIFGVVFLIFLGLQRKYQTISLPFAITTTGFASMVLQLILLFGFQIVYGYVFYEIGILITAFMAGLAIGGILTATWPSHGRRKLGIFMKIEFSIILLSILLIFFFRYLEAGIHVEPIFVRIAFLLLLLVSGLLTGMEFPLANRLYVQQTDYFSFRRDDIGKTVGLLYCVDLLGGWVGGVLGGFLLIPTLGIAQGCIALAILKVCSFLLLFTFPRK